MSGNILDALAHPATINLLADYKDASAAANSIWQNRDWQAKQAAGNAFRNSLNPDGTPNQPQLNQNLAADPATALAAQDSAQKGQALDNATFTTQLARMTSLHNAAAALLAQHPDGNVSQADVWKEIDQQGQQLNMPPQQIAQAKAQFGPDPAANGAMILRNLSTGLSASQALIATRPGTGTVDTGPSVTGTQTPPQLGTQPLGGVTPVGAPIQTYPSRASLAGRVQVGVDAKGAPIYGPAANVTPPNLAGPGAAPVSPLGTGRPPAGSPLLNPAKPAAQPSAAGAAPPVPNEGNVTTGLGPAQSAAQEATGRQSGLAFQQYAADGNKAVQQNAILGNMLADTKDFTTGPLNARIKAFQSFASTYAPKISGNFGLDSKTVAANESFDKLAAQLADAQGAGSDNRLAVNQAANPHGEMAPASVDLVLRQLQGNADYTRAKANLAEAYPDKSDSAGFEKAAQKNLDPRAFQFARMTVPQRQTYVAALSKDDKTAVQGAYNWAVTHGMIGGSGASQ